MKAPLGREKRSMDTGSCHHGALDSRSRPQGLEVICQGRSATGYVKDSSNDWSYQILFATIMYIINIYCCHLIFSPLGCHACRSLMVLLPTEKKSLTCLVSFEVSPNGRAFECFILSKSPNGRTAENQKALKRALFHAPLHSSTTR